LFHKQYALKENGYADHAAWRREWRAARSDQFQVQGSNDETAGCDGCIAAIQEDGSILLRLQLPNDGGFLKIGPVRFPYQVDKLHAALTAHATINKRTLPLKPLKGKSQTVERQRRFRIYPDELTGLTWRFQRDDRGWRVSVSFTPVKPPVVTRIAAGAIGVDVNADHLACAELDRSGNPVETWNVLCVTYGKTTEQSEAIIEAAAIGIVRKAKTACKPIVLENLDFAKKKRALEEDGGKRYARMLSSLSYQKIQQAILARAAKEGVEVREVNPAFTSVIGRINYADRYGLTVHQGAAVAIGRRAFGLFKSHEKTGKPIKKFGFRENVLCRKADDGVKTVVAPDGRGGHVTFPYPEWNTRKHVWSLLSKVSRELKAALAARVRMTGRKRLRSSSDEHPPGGMVTVT
jgi:IS605 OrfB family transposase